MRIGNPFKLYGKAASWAGRQLFGSGPPDPYKGQLQNQITRDTGRGGAAEDFYYDRARTFDPYQSIRTAAGGLFDEFERGVGQGIQDVRGNLVGAGRLGGGYGDLDESAYVFDARRDLNNKLAGLAVQGAQMEAENFRDIGSYGERTSGRALDLMTGERDRSTAIWNAQNQRKAQLAGILAKLAGQAITRGQGAGGGA